MRLVFDLESDGLYQEATQVWCICGKDIDTNEHYSVDVLQHDIHDYLHSSECFLSMANVIIGHNIINYDLPVLKKLYGFVPGGELIDTLIVSRLLNPDRLPVKGVKGAHGLEAWGVRFGRQKPEHEDWSQYSPEMLHRCQEDVEINVLTYHELMKERDNG